MRVNERQFVVHANEQELRDGGVDTVGKLAAYIRRNPRYSALCGESIGDVARVFMNGGSFEVLPSEPLNVIRDNDEIMFVSLHILRYLFVCNQDLFFSG